MGDWGTPQKFNGRPPVVFRGAFVKSQQHGDMLLCLQKEKSPPEGYSLSI